jgi:ribosomal protein S27AE
MAIGFPVEGLKEATARRWTYITDTGECPRCGGLMVIEPFVDILEDRKAPDLEARRCVQCGEAIDPVILRNRRRPLPSSLSVSESGASSSSEERS